MERQVRIQNLVSTLFLDGYSEIGSIVTTRPDNGSNFQNWVLEPVPSGFRFRNVGSGLYLSQGIGSLENTVITSPDTGLYPGKRGIWQLVGAEIINLATNKALTSSDVDSEIISTDSDSTPMVGVELSDVYLYNGKQQWIPFYKPGSYA